jgi:hypothetical protein
VINDEKYTTLRGCESQMIYLLGIILSLIVCGQLFALEITNGNINHVKNGRIPNAGAALFPLIPTLPLLAAGGTWLLEAFVPDFATWIILACFLLFTIVWAVSFARLRAEFQKTVANSDVNKPREEPL